MRLHTIMPLAALLTASCAVSASPVTDLITVHETNNYPPALQSFDFTYRLTFDPTLTYTDATAGLTLISVTTPNSSGYLNSFSVPTGFDYSPGGSLSIGGLALGVLGGNLNSDDYLLTINNFTSASPSLYQLAVGTANPNLSGFNQIAPFSFAGNIGTVMVTPSAPSAITPEPSSFTLLGTGLLGLAAIALQRKRIQRLA